MPLQLRPLQLGSFLWLLANLAKGKLALDCRHSACGTMLSGVVNFVFKVVLPCLRLANACGTASYPALVVVYLPLALLWTIELCMDKCPAPSNADNTEHAGLRSTAVRIAIPGTICCNPPCRASDAAQHQLLNLQTAKELQIGCAACSILHAITSQLQSMHEQKHNHVIAG